MLSDIRLRRTIEDIIFPSPKEGMNPRSLSYLRLVLCDKSNSLLFVSFPKSGWNWSGDILGYCIIKHFTGEYKVEFQGEGSFKERQRKPYYLFTPADSRTAGEKKVSEKIPGLKSDYFLHTHECWKASPLWGLDSARTIFIVRNIPTMLFSYYKSRGKKFSSFEECLDHGVLEQAINFYNSWGEYCQHVGMERVKIFRFEDYKKEPVESFHKLLTSVTGIDMGKDIVKEALDYYSIEKQKQREFKISKDETTHFHFKGKSDYTDMISEKTLNGIYAKLHSDLTHDFGYEYPEKRPEGPT